MFSRRSLLQSFLFLPTVSLNQSIFFEKELEILSKSNNFCIISEGVPLFESIEISKFEFDSFNGFSNHQKLDFIGSKFGFDVEQISESTFSLFKNYTLDHDLPEVTLEESIRSYSSLKESFSDYIAEEGPVSTMINLLNSLNSDQINKQIFFSTLSAEQKTIARQMFFSSEFFLGAAEIKNCLFAMKAYYSPKSKYTFYVNWGKEIRSLVGPFWKYRGKIWDSREELSEWFSLDHADSHSFKQVPGKVYLENNKLIIKIKDATDPDFNVKKPIYSHRIDLKDLNKIMKNIFGGDTADVNIHSQYFRKTFCLFGDEFGSPITILKAIQKIYGFRLFKENDKYIVTHPVRSAVLDYQNPQKEFEKLISPPVMRMTLQHIKRTRKDAKYYSAFCTDVVKKLRTIVDPLVDKSPNRSVSTVDAGPDAANLYALMHMHPLQTIVFMLFRPPSIILQNLEKSEFIISVKPDKKGKGNEAIYNIYFKDADGKVWASSAGMQF